GGVKTAGVQRDLCAWDGRSTSARSPGSSLTTSGSAQLPGRGFVSQEALVFVSFLFGPLGRYSAPHADDINERGESTDENHEYREHHLSTLPWLFGKS